MTEDQALLIQGLIGKKCRIGMYVATTTDHSQAVELKEWQEDKDETGAEVKYTVRLRTVQRAGRLATD